MADFLHNKKTSAESQPQYSPGDVNGDFHHPRADGSESSSCCWYAAPNRKRRREYLTYAVLAIAATFIIPALLALGVSVGVIVIWPILQTMAASLPNQTAAVAAPSLLQTSPGAFKAGSEFRCGNSPAEARSMNCVFDLMSAAWLPRDCFDQELNAEFMELDPWEFYTSDAPVYDLRDVPDSQKTLLAGPEAIGDSPGSLWTSRRFHITHCIYSWKQMHRSIERGWKMEGTLATYHHTEHCSTALANTSVPLDAIVTRVEISFPAC
ncbi:hypothetical protein CH063_05961 [Colletotrichum higginsianum]|uniref:Major facilitator superfamily transporter n=2 Tax=Colletotrichum higginsianum TaxID=80884 RepID=H1V0V3_COLHI|nr:Major facilitator superfamily transporter [Colletotrichum higginsianum IMI 349063]OBR03328.1 Major facilitator superfamily transporter [Colletotrichum higginsianum IMI 349063]TIC89984.1 hypothetical protein CH35J_012419 [Colletotrichum higginsianum]CCF33854.1 hypothetical protein CH063_05961 [Colletotrichum higginsianum]